MTETLKVKYSFVLYFFKFFDKFTEISRYKEQHHLTSLINEISPKTVNVFHVSRSEIRLRCCLCIRLFVHDLTSKHVPNK